MKKCEECGKKLGIVEGYQHPTLGKKHPVCGPCYDKVSESVEKWRNFVLNNSLDLNNLMEYAKRNGLKSELLKIEVINAGMLKTNKTNVNLS
jgi:hypothetical protein